MFESMLKVLSRGGFPLLFIGVDEIVILVMAVAVGSEHG
jgi:hypothetical protein